MEDRQIVDLCWARSEVAITEAQKEYYAYCLAIAKRLLGDERDAEEVVNDAFLAAWHSIPPQRPEVLSAYLGKLTRRIAIDRIRQRTAKRRGFSETELALEELEEILPSGQDPAAEGREGKGAPAQGSARGMEAEIGHVKQGSNRGILCVCPV